jgi:hypothetical protein
MENKRENELKPVMSAAILISISAISYFFGHGDILLYGDARSHVNIAREVFDNLTPGFVQLGGVWPFLFHILELPFVTNNFLWRTGLAGSIVSAIAFIGSGTFVFKLVKEITGKTLPGLLAFLVFGLNPNILYMQSIPMTEMWMMFAFIGSVYYLYKWFKTGNTTSLVGSAFFVFLGTWVRYDAWFLVAAEMATIALWMKFKVKGKDVMGKVILFGFGGCFGIILWVLWNYLIWGNPVYFLLGQNVSAHAQQSELQAIGQLPAKHNALISFLTYLWDCIDIAGIVSIIISGAAFLFLIIKNRITAENVVIFLLLSLFVFNVISLYLGFTAIFIPQVNPETAIWNVRFGLTILFFVSIAPFLLFPKKAFVNVIIFLIMISNSCYLVYSKNIITYNEAVSGNGAFNSNDMPLAEWFNKNYDNGMTLISFTPNNPLAQAIGLPLKIYVHEGTRKYWTSALNDPEKTIKWIIVSQGDLIDRKFAGTNKLTGYAEVFKTQDVKVYKIRQN